MKRTLLLFLMLILVTIPAGVFFASNRHLLVHHSQNLPGQLQNNPLFKLVKE